jgi:hypothetical protein
MRMAPVCRRGFLPFQGVRVPGAPVGRWWNERRLRGDVSGMKLLALALSMGLLGAVLVPAPAGACGNAVAVTKRQAVRYVKKAEKSLAQGADDRALAYATGALAFVHAKGRRTARGQAAIEADPLWDRARRIVATAHLRSGGEWEPFRQWVRPQRDPAARQASVDAAAAELARQRAASGDDVHLTALHAEAMAAKGEKEKARALLLDLVERDLMPDAWAWLALARLESDPERRTEALMRCRKATRTKAICRE